MASSKLARPLRLCMSWRPRLRAWEAFVCHLFVCLLNSFLRETAGITAEASLWFLMGTVLGIYMLNPLEERVFQALPLFSRDVVAVFLFLYFGVDLVCAARVCFNLCSFKDQTLVHRRLLLIGFVRRTRPPRFPTCLRQHEP